MRLAIKNLVIIVFFVVFIYIKWVHFMELNYSLHFFLDLMAISFVYLFAQPTLIHTFRKRRKEVVYTISGTAMILCLLWNMERVMLFQNLFGIELYFIPIVLSTLFLSIKVGLLFTLISSISHFLIKLFHLGFSFQLILEGLLLLIAYGLTVVLTAKVLKQRDTITNKRGILVEDSNSLVLGIDNDGRVDLCNKKMMDLLGVEEENIRNQYFWKLDKFVRNHEALQILNLLYNEQDHAQTEFQLEYENKQCTFIFDTYTLEDDGFTGGQIIVLRDITERKQLELKLKELATTDGLTGLYNRRYFEQKFKEETKRSQRYTRPLSLIMLDIDHFKNINDTHGHLAGDGVIKEVALSVLQTIRETDICARMGGEEFAVLLPETTQGEAKSIAERIQLSVQNLEINVGGQNLNVTISLGVTTKESQSDIREMIDQADKALYRAKENGRNQFQVA